MLPDNDPRLKHCIPQVYTTPFIERVWANGVVYREVYAVNTPEGALLANEFLSQFPTETYVSDNPLNWIGYSAGGVREPYTNTTFSVYTWNQLSKELADQFGCEDGFNVYSHNLPWYRLKYDTDTKETMLKVPFLVVHPIEHPYVPRPKTIPTNHYEFFGRIYHSDGQVDPSIDCYIATSVETMRDFCTEVGMTFPVPDDHLEHVNLWGIVYDSTTLEITMVKAYEIVPYNT